MLDNREQQIIDFIKNTGECSSKQVFENMNTSVSYATLKRSLTNLKAHNFLLSKGLGKGTKYFLSPIFELIQPIDMEEYYQKEIDERQIKDTFNFEILTDVLNKYHSITETETSKLILLQKNYKSNIEGLSENEYTKELERLTIDLSWKSSQIEGNTYSLLETERLLKDKETATGKTKEEAVMLLNHKEALDFLIKNNDYLAPLTVAKIENIHFILTKELNIERNLRKRHIGISGTNYKPIANEFQIIEALKNSCDVINSKKNIFEKALLSIVLISYIQPFMDGNKRTARIISNGILMNYGYCPLSFRTVDSLDYKKALLLFYEQNNISNFKNIFINQFEFAVNTYF